MFAKKKKNIHQSILFVGVMVAHLSNGHLSLNLEINFNGRSLSIQEECCAY